MGLKNLLPWQQQPKLVRGLRLRRPLAVLDLETTGTNTAVDRVVEICVLRLAPDGSERLLHRRVNPEMPIPQEASRVHGITDVAVAGEPPFRGIAGEIRAFLDGCDLAGFNIIRFDLPLLEAEFARAGVEFSREGRAVVDTLSIFHMKERRDLAAAAALYLGRTMPEVHASETDVRTTLEILAEQVRRYDDVPEDIGELHELCNPVNPDWIDPDGKLIWIQGLACVGFGKHKGRPLAELVETDSDYLQWMLGRDFSPTVAQIIRNALDGNLPSPPIDGAAKRSSAEVP